MNSTKRMQNLAIDKIGITNSNQCLNIKNIQIPLIIRSYKTSKSVKIFFKNNILTITKPNNLSNKKLIEIVKQNEDYIYNKYLERTK